MADVSANDAELTTLRWDKLVMLALRGFERPCAWSGAECWEALDIQE